ncbi:MAG: hypothetical protein CSA20_01895 [Deltaproteobacteria bacterium]|nr:MAG: hypothetical protein CSA20_01895 [Deltaproteobacteria bacterium]
MHSKICLLENQKGAAAVEFALVVPVLLLILFATIEYGWYLTNNMVLINAVADGARAGVKAREWENEDPEDFARKAVLNAMWLSKNAVSSHLEIEILDDAPPRRLSVKAIDVPYSPLTGYLGEAMIPSVLAAKAVVAFP